MKHLPQLLPVLFLLAAATVVSAQEVETVCGQYTFHAPKGMPRATAMRLALHKARLQALTDAFGTAETRTDTLAAGTGRTETDRSATSMTTTHTEAQWLGDEGKPQYTFSTNKDNGTLAVTCRVCGKARKKPADPQASDAASDGTVP